MAIFQNFTTQFKEWLALRAESCKNVVQLFSNSYDRKLSFFEKLRVRLHLLTCSACLNYISNLKFMHEMFQIRDKSFEQEKAHVSLSPEAAQRIKNALKSSN